MKKTLLTSIAALFLATGAAQALDCDTTHTSDLHAVWQCGDACVRLLGPPLNRQLVMDFNDDAARYRTVFKRNLGKATLNGKRCKSLPQTYPDDKEQK